MPAKKMPNARCEICPHGCVLSEGDAGFCGARKNIGGQVDSYGKITAIAVDPIEKKPLMGFFRGSDIVSIGSYGCNFRCGFCQNAEIAWPDFKIRGERDFTPAEIVAIARKTPNNLGVAYTYNEPLINYEFLYDCAREIHAVGMKNVVVTNGFINPEPLEKLLPYIDAMNIDLKAFTTEFYKKIGGDLDIVKNTIARAQKSCHVEITTLLIPGENDNDIEPIAKWLASEISPDTPLHISRFFPRHKYAHLAPTPVETILRAAEIAKKYLKNVFCGNI
ncbi:MAG: AmmeMemoRadiSam system radical SAM enzyme [Defluviitaleaceae bacterium]|nr:AmmeMemoRadiSam system radical SAM enzyme [Defluviitaleaceae bacterium]